MPTIAVINRKGGSGKSTLATNIAGWCAARGWQVMIGDVDRQQSIKSWLQRRHPAAAKVHTWVLDSGKVFRAPRGTTHAVLDTPGAVYDYALSRIVVWVDAIVVPIGPSIFDRDASLACLHDLRKHPRVVSGRCKLIAVGMRWPKDRVDQWLASGRQWDTQLLTVIPEDVIYRECLEGGGSIFDVGLNRLNSQMVYWAPLLEWLSMFWTGEHPARPEPVGGQTATPTTVASTRASGALVSPERIVDEEKSALPDSPVSAEKGYERQIPSYLLSSGGADSHRRTEATIMTHDVESLVGSQMVEPKPEKPSPLVNADDARKATGRQAKAAVSPATRSWLSRLWRSE
jgi:chromosome partitioning protein